MFAGYLASERVLMFGGDYVAWQLVASKLRGADDEVVVQTMPIQGVRNSSDVTAVRFRLARDAGATLEGTIVDEECVVSGGSGFAGLLRQLDDILAFNDAEELASPGWPRISTTSSERSALSVAGENDNIQF